MKRWLPCLLAATALLRADALLVPNVTVLGTNSADGMGFDNGGPSFTVGSNLLGTDTLSLMVSGTVDLASGQFTANAAGIIIGPDPTNTGNHPGEVAPNSGNPALNYAALLIGNGTLGFFQVFPSSADFGLGNASPPSTLTLTDRTLADIGFVGGLTSGTVLEFRVSDINFGDNSGAFDITQGAVPEPGTTMLLVLFLCGIAVARWRISQKLGPATLRQP
jgi:hypothetical protein